MEKSVRVDVLVIGGGATGTRAALEADEQGAQVVIVVKDTLKQGGATAYGADEFRGFNATFGHTDSLDNPELHFEDEMTAGLGLCDVKLARIVANESLERLLDLEKWGVNFKKVDSKYFQVQGCFSSKPRTCLTQGHEIIKILSKEIKRRNILVQERTMITSLLTRGNLCVGAIGISEKGDPIIFKTKSTILATGGLAQLFPLNIYPPNITGDGYAMGYRIGADLMNMEFLQMGFGTVYPTLNLFNPRLWSLHPKIYNVKGERFPERYLPPSVTPESCFNSKATHFPFSTRDESMYLEIAAYEEIKAGRGTKHQGVYVDFTDIPVDEIARKSGNVGLDWLKSRGIDICGGPIEISVVAHTCNGGLRINEKCQTTIQGLYAAGECAAGPHGADRLGGNMLSTTQVLGARAGKFAAKYALSISEPELNEKQVQAEQVYFQHILENSSGVWVMNVKKSIQELMWKNVLIVREEEGLTRCIAELERIKKKVLPTISIRKQSELFDALALRNMVDVGLIIASAAKKREESRGGHFRRDYPESDRLPKKIIVKFEQGQMGLCKI